jgi:hypothetical protein
MNDIDKIYATFGKNFCLSPFLSAFYQTNQVVSNNKPSLNTVVPCCAIQWKGHPNASNIVNNSLKSSINTNIWKDLRKKFVEGQFQKINECQNCITAERLGGSSVRIGANMYFAGSLDTDIIVAVQKIINNDYYVDDILSLDWFPSNYCNFSCVMCSGGASSARMTYEIKILKQEKKMVINAVDSDFYEILKNAEAIKFTGGETLMQPQIHDLLKYMVENNIAANKTLLFLSNVSSSLDDKILELYSHFRQIIYVCSLDGINDVIEYQRRGCDWSTVEKNSLALLHHPTISTVCHFVLTAINALNVADFVKWLANNQIKNGISVSSVYREDHLTVDAMPDQLRQLAITRLREIYDFYPKYQYFMDMILSNMEQAIYNPIYHQKFCQQIKNEDRVSAKQFCSVVPEWAEYFIN